MEKKDVLIKLFFDAITPCLKNDNNYEIEDNVLNALKQIFNSSFCHFKKLIHERTSSNKDNPSSSRLIFPMNCFDKSSKYCNDKDLTELITNKPFKYYTICNCHYPPRRIIKLRVFSTPVERVETKNTNNVFAIICIVIEAEQEGYSADELFNLEKTISFYFYHRIIAYYHELWHRVRSKIRENSNTTMADIFDTCIKSFETINVPIKYSCIFTYAKANNDINHRQKHYLIKQKCKLFDKYLNQSEKGIEVDQNNVIEFFINEKNDAFTPEIARQWLKKYTNSSHTSEYEFKINPRSETKLLNSALEKIDYSYVIAFPIINTENGHAISGEIFKGLIVMLLSPSFPDLSFFKRENLQLLNISIIRSLNVAKLFTNKILINDKINEYSPLFITSPASFHEKIFKAFIKDAFELKAFEIWELHKSRIPRKLYHLGAGDRIVPVKNISTERELVNILKNLSFKKNSVYSYYIQNELSGVIAYIKGQSTRGIILCQHRLSNINKASIIPYNQEDIELLIGLGNRILFLHDSKKEQRKVVEMARVVNHETTNAIFSLTETLEDVSSRIPEDIEKRKEIKLLFKDISDAFELLQNIHNWPKILSGNFKIDKELVPVLGLYYKYKKLYRNRLKAKSLDVNIPPVSVNEIGVLKSRPKVLADKALVDHSVSNLLSNAIKYSYEGTFIKADSYLKKSNSTEEHIMSIQNIGIGIHKDELKEIFELFYRTTDAKHTTSTGEGSGAGLFIVKMCIANHKWPFTLPKSCKISRFCLPVVFWLERNNKWHMIKDPQVKDEAKTEYLRCKDQFEKFYNDSYDSVKLNTFINSAILKETYLTEFRITIPI